LLTGRCDIKGTEESRMTPRSDRANLTGMGISLGGTGLRRRTSQILDMLS
jgi:hypothetical protein